MRNLARDPRGGGQLARQPRQDDGLPPGPRRLRGDERGLRASRRRPPPCAVDRRGRAAFRPGRSSRSRRSRIVSRLTWVVTRSRARAPRLGQNPPRCRPRSAASSARSSSTRTSSAAAVRDELLGVDARRRGLPRPGRRPRRRSGRLLEPHGRVEDMEVHGQLVGVRLHPRDRAVRALVPTGIELTPPRAERSTGPGTSRLRDRRRSRRSGRGGHGATRLHRQRDGARLADGALVDPFGGSAGPRRPRLLRTVSDRRASTRTRCASSAACGSSPSSASGSRTRRSPRCVAQADGAARTSPPERIGGGLAADGLGELSKLLLGRDPATALRLARDTGVLVAMLPELEPRSATTHRLGAAAAAARRAPLRRRRSGRRRGRPLERPAGGAPARSREAGRRIRDGEPHAALGAAIAAAVLRRLRYPTCVRRHVRAIVAATAFQLDPWLAPDDGGRATRRFLASHGRRARDRASCGTSGPTSPSSTSAPRSSQRSRRLDRELEQESSHPHRIADLAVNGDDLLARGLAPGPAVGTVLRSLLDRVVDDPALNDHDTLLALAGGRAAR